MTWPIIYSLHIPITSQTFLEHHRFLRHAHHFGNSCDMPAISHIPQTYFKTSLQRYSMYNAQFTCSHDDMSNEPIHKLYNVAVFRDHPSYGLSQWEMMLQGNIVSRCKWKQDSVGVRRILVVPRDSGGASTGFCWCILSDKRSRY